MKKFLIASTILTSIISFSQETKTKDIDEVTLTKKVIQKKSDRLVYDVSATPVTKGNTAFGLLKETPLVSTTDDKTLKIAGKSNAIIYINGRKSNMNADALEAFLKSMPAENISKIEVITVPGSEFNVESKDGIINIILKKKQTDGTSGNLRFGNKTAERNSQNASASINFRKDKLAISSNLNVRNEVRWQDYILTNGDNTSSNTSVGMVKNTDLGTGGYINLDYDLTEKQTIGLSYNAWFSKTYDTSADLFNTITFLNPNNNNWETIYNRAVNTMDSKDRNNSINANYEVKLDENGSKLNLNAAYLNYHQFQNNMNRTYFADADNTNLGLKSQTLQTIPQDINNISTTVDFTKVFKKFTLGLGGNFNKTNTENDTKYENLDGSFLYNHFIYDEKIGGVYANAEKNFGDKFSAKVGARMEFTNSFGEILNTSIDIKRNHNDFLPTLNFNYNVNEKNSLSYSFTSRMRRPSFWELSPEKIYLTEVNYVQNNPFMKASKVYNQELMYMYKNTYFLQISNSYTKDASTQVPLQRTVNGISELRYIRTNYGTENQFSVNIGFNKTFFDNIWTANYTLGIQNTSYKGSVDTDPITGDIFSPYDLNDSLTTPLIQTNNTIRLSKKKDLFLGINYFYMGKQRIDLGTLQPLQRLDLNLKKIWNSWTFTVDLNDVLKTFKIDFYDKQKNGTYNSVNQYQYTQNINFGITYNFGNQKVKKARNLDGAADDIKNRTGN